MRCTERRLTPAALASSRPVQWVLSPGGGPKARSTTRRTVLGGSGGLPGLRVLSRNSPSTPSAMNRACQVHTTGFDLPDRRMISAVPQPSAVARITLARHTCFCGALRSATIASSRRRSARVTLTTIPALIMRAWTASADLGIVRMNQTTSEPPPIAAMAIIVHPIQTWLGAIMIAPAPPNPTKARAIPIFPSAWPLWLDLRPQLVEHKLSNIPISFTMRQTGFCTGRAGLGNTLENDALAFVFGPVLVANTSSTNRVILDFTLLVNGSDGTHLKILSRVRDGYGRIYGQKAAETRRKHGLETPIYLISPVEIDPQKSVQGKLAFIYGPVGEGPMTEFVKNSFSHDYEYTLVVSDKISTTSVELKMPWEYPTH